MKKFALLVWTFVLSFVIELPAQDFLWVQNGGGGGGSAAHSIKADRQGNTYAVGTFGGDLTFCNISVKSYGQHDIFLVKFGPDGKPLWIRQAGSATDGETANELLLDNAGNVYVTGDIRGKSTFGSNSFIDARLSDVFLAKYNSEGILQWVTTGGGPGFDGGRSLAIDNSGTIYLGGIYQNEIIFGNQKVSGGTGFLASFHPNGNIKNIKNLGDAIVSSLAFDEKQSLFLAGSYSGLGNFIEAPVMAVGGRDVFITKLNLATNQIEWTKVGGSTKDESITSIGIDETGNCYLTGINGAGFGFGGFNINFYGGFSDFFVAKISANGQLLWFKNGGGKDEDTSLKLNFNSAGQVYITGLFTGQASFSNNISLISQGKGDMFVAQFDVKGGLEKVYHVKGADKEKSMGITSDESGNIWMSGTIPGKTQFGTLNVTTPNSFTQMFVAKIGLGPTIANVCTAATLPVTDKINYQINIPNIITPNADGKNDVFAINVDKSTQEEVNLTIYNRWGKKILDEKNYLNNWNGDNVPRGVYYYTAKIIMNGEGKNLYKGWVEVIK